MRLATHCPQQPRARLNLLSQNISSSPRLADSASVPLSVGIRNQSVWDEEDERAIERDAAALFGIWPDFRRAKSLSPLSSLQRVLLHRQSCAALPFTPTVPNLTLTLSPLVPRSSNRPFKAHFASGASRNYASALHAATAWRAPFPRATTPCVYSAPTLHTHRPGDRQLIHFGRTA